MRWLAIIGFLVLLVSCGSGGNQPSAVSVQLSDGGGILQAASEPASQSLDEALAELDALQAPEGVDAALFRELKDALASQLGSRPPISADAAKNVCQAPVGDHNKPFDLTLVDMGNGEYRLLWHEVNIGDYDNNGTVAIADITPIAMHYGESCEPADMNCPIALIDSSGNNKVDIADISGIAMNFGTSLAGYNVYVDGALHPGEGGLSVTRPAEPGAERVGYSYSLELGGLVNVTVRPADPGGAEGVESDAAQLGTGDAPAAPQNLDASASEAIGAGRILLTWTANTEDDLAEYRLYRTDGVVAYEQVATISSTTFPLMYTDDNDEALLESGVEYTYYLTAVDEDGFESAPSEEAAAAPYFPAAPTAPTALDASDETDPYGLCIALDWVASESPYLQGYEVFRKAEGETEFAAVATVGSSGASFMDSGLTEGVTYTYRVQAYDTYNQRSDFSNEDSSLCSPYVAVEILSVSAPQTTYGFGETAKLTADVTNPAATITWAADAGSFPGGNTGRAVTWVPPGTACKVSFNVNADDETTSDSDNSLEVVSTTMYNLGPAPGFSLSSRQGVALSTYLGSQCVILLSFDDYC